MSLFPEFEIPEDQYRTCVKCEVRKHVSEFRLDKSIIIKTGYRPECRICEQAYSKEMKRIHAMAPPKPEDNMCECCGIRPIKCLDHDHKTKKVRGWVCTKCNRGLAMLGDEIDGLKKAISYLESCK